MAHNYFDKLTEEEKRVIVDKGTEAPYTGEYDNFYQAGVFVCKACGNPLYDSSDKFDAGCGWPSFDKVKDGAVNTYSDFKLGYERTEITCARCDGHLGHVFLGEQLTNENTRHCVNSISVRFISNDSLKKATFAAGCFWGVEEFFRSLKGVYSTDVGYIGGKTKNPTYKEVCNQTTNHAEAVEVIYDPKQITFEELIAIFWENHDPTTLNKQGTRDYVVINDNNKGYAEVSDVVNFIASDDDRTKGMTRNGQKADYCPTKKLKISINKADIISKNIVAPEDTSRIVNEIRWELKGNSINKNELMVLDILANFNWERPIYFAITVGNDNFMGLEKYFQLEGLAYRFVPYLSSSNDGQTGEVATDIMYDNVMNKFKWGNLGDSTIYLDETNMRMTLNFKNNFSRLADALILEKDFERAKNVLDKCLAVMPNEAIPYSFFNLPIAEGYYKIGNPEKAREIINILIDIYFEELEYYNSLDDEVLSKMDRDYQIANQIISNLYTITTMNNDTDLQQKIVEEYQKYQ